MAVCLRIFILVMVCSINTNVVTAQIFSKESSVTIVAEGLTTTPSFYHGRAEPSPGNPVRLIAVTPGVEGVLAYQWSVAGHSVDQVPVWGKRSITFNAPESSTLEATVIVFTETGERIGSTQISVSLTSPSVHLYEENLLRGLSRNTLGDDYIMGSGELTVRALPYFMDPMNLSQANLVTWAVNGRPVATSLTDPLSVTLIPGDPGGTSRVEVAFRNHSLLTEQLKTMFTLHY